MKKTLASIALLGVLITSLSTNVKADDDIKWKKELKGAATAYQSMAMDIQIARESNAIKRIVGGKIGYDFPKMHVMTSLQQLAVDAYEKNDEGWMFNNKSGSRYGSPHKYPKQIGDTGGGFEPTQETWMWKPDQRHYFLFSETNMAGVLADVTNSDMGKLTVYKNVEKHRKIS